VSAARLAVLGVLLGALCSPVFAAEMRAEAQVVDVVALGSDTAAQPDCQPPKPATDVGLPALLAWDLRVECPASPPSTSKYRVYYRWDGRTYSRDMHAPPGATIPLRVRLD
jgi:hypothetical protein